MYITIHYDGDIGRQVVENIIWFFEIPKTIDRVACEILFDYLKFKKNLSRKRAAFRLCGSCGFSKTLKSKKYYEIAKHTCTICI